MVRDLFNVHFLGEAAETAIAYSIQGNTVYVIEEADTGLIVQPRVVTTGRVRDGLVACIQEIRSAFYIPDLYCALGVLLLRSGERSKAYAAFQRGLRLDQHHMGIKARVRDMGLRRSPVLPFLSRRNPANRVLGVVRARICRG